MSKYLIPTIEEIKKSYNEIIPLMRELKTKEDIINFEKKHNVTMEINYDLIKEYNGNPIEVIRCEHWGDLDYIYFYTDESEPMFDVWCDFMDVDFIDGTTIENLEKDYIEGIKWLWSFNKSNKENLKELIKSLRQYEINYNDMIDVYGFETEIVEEYENSNYEIGYGDNTNMNNIEEFMNNLTVEEIDLENKINDLYESGELENDMMFDLIRDNIRVQNEICKQIKKDVFKYKEDIVSETEYLFNNELIHSEHDYSSGMYNMDKLYVESIKEVFDLGHYCN